MASSTIGVAGTIFSITIAALSLASGQMGPRLIRNFVRDARNQLALGIFLGTFAYALAVLRTVRTADEGTFVPHVGVTGAMLLSLVCVGTLVWFVHHVATSIKVETVVGVVHQDLVAAVGGGALDARFTDVAYLQHAIPGVKNLSGVVEFTAANSADRRVADTYAIDTALAYLVDDNTQFDVASFVGLNRAAPDFQITSGIVHRV